MQHIYSFYKTDYIPVSLRSPRIIQNISQHLPELQKFSSIYLGSTLHKVNRCNGTDYGVYPEYIVKVTSLLPIKASEAFSLNLGQFYHWFITATPVMNDQRAIMCLLDGIKVIVDLRTGHTRTFNLMTRSDPVISSPENNAQINALL